MGVKDFNEILIKDLPYYYGSCVYVSTFKNNRIETVGQLLDKNLMAPIIKNSRKSKYEIKGLISLVEHQFLGEKLPNDELLSRKIIKHEFNCGTMIIVFEKNGKYEFMPLSTLCSEIVLNAPFASYTLVQDILLSDKELLAKLDNSKMKVIDLMKAVINSKTFTRYEKDHKRCQIMGEIYRISIDAYEIKSSKLDIKYAEGAIKKLQKKLTKIQERRSELDLEETNINKEILMYEEFINNGNIRR